MRRKEFFDYKANYIHLNPVRAGIVEKEEDYLNSSASTMYGLRKGNLNSLCLVDTVRSTYNMASEFQIPKSRLKL